MSNSDQENGLKLRSYSPAGPAKLKSRQVRWIPGAICMSRPPLGWLLTSSAPGGDALPAGGGMASSRCPGMSQFSTALRRGTSPVYFTGSYVPPSSLAICARSACEQFWSEIFQEISLSIVYGRIMTLGSRRALKPQ